MCKIHILSRKGINCWWLSWQLFFIVLKLQNALWNACCIYICVMSLFKATKQTSVMPTYSYIHHTFAYTLKYAHSLLKGNEMKGKISLSLLTYGSMIQMRDCRMHILVRWSWSIVIIQPQKAYSSSHQMFIPNEIFLLTYNISQFVWLTSGCPDRKHKQRSGRVIIVAPPNFFSACFSSTNTTEIWPESFFFFQGKWHNRDQMCSPDFWTALIHSMVFWHVWSDVMRQS